MTVEKQGTPVGRRIVLGMVGLGAAGIVTGRWLSDGVSTVVASTAPGLAGVLPAAGGFRIYTVTNGYPSVEPVPTVSPWADGSRRTSP